MNIKSHVPRILTQLLIHYNWQETTAGRYEKRGKAVYINFTTPNILFKILEETEQIPHETIRQQYQELSDKDLGL